MARVFSCLLQVSMPAASFRWLQKALLSRSFPLRPAFLQGPRQSASLLPPVRSRRHVKFVPTLSHHLAPTPAFALGFGNARALAFVAAALQACDRPVAAPRCVCPRLSTACHSNPADSASNSVSQQ